MKFLSHDHEFSHHDRAFLSFNLGPAPDPMRRVLVWGENIDVTLTP